jgi:hypothetical protein
MPEGISLRKNSSASDDAFLVLLSITFVLGMVIGVLLVFLWRQYPATITQGAMYLLAEAVCPPFLLVGVFGAMTDSTLALVLTGGTIVIANGSLYAGVAAFAYWALSVLWPKKKKA